MGGFKVLPRKYKVEDKTSGTSIIDPNSQEHVIGDFILSRM